MRALPLSVAALVWLIGCEEDGSVEGASSTGGDTSSGEPQGDLEIIGSYTDSVGSHMISNLLWVHAGTTLNIERYNNFEDWCAGQDDNSGTFILREWLRRDGELYYCTSAAGLATLEAAVNAPRADRSSPLEAGCGEFGWMHLVPS